MEKGHSKARSLSRLIAANSRWRRNSFDAWRNESLKLWRNMWGEEEVARMRREQVLLGHGPAANPPKVKAGIFLRTMEPSAVSKVYPFLLVSASFDSCHIFCLLWIRSVFLIMACVEILPSFPEESP